LNDCNLPLLEFPIKALKLFYVQLLGELTIFFTSFKESVQNQLIMSF